MVIQMLLSLHGIYTELASDGRLCEHIRSVMVIHHAVGNMLDNRSGPNSSLIRPAALIMNLPDCTGQT